MIALVLSFSFLGLCALCLIAFLVSGAIKYFNGVHNEHEDLWILAVGLVGLCALLASTGVIAYHYSAKAPAQQTQVERNCP